MWPFDPKYRRHGDPASRFVPAQVLELIDSGRMQELNPQVRDVTILSTDFINFNGFTEHLELEALWDFLRSANGAIENAISNHGGLLDTWFGDAALAFWNVPTPIQGPQARACLAILDVVAAFEKLTGKSAIDGGPTITAGINAGKAVAGVMEYGRRLRYTAYGDEVSLAHLIQAANSFFGTRILISDSIFTSARSAIAGRFVGDVRVKGMNRTVRLHELIGRMETLPLIWNQFLKDFTVGVEHYNGRQFDKAKKAFRLANEQMPGDKLTRLYLGASEDHIKSPPPENWEPTFNLTVGSGEKSAP